MEAARALPLGRTTGDPVTYVYSLNLLGIFMRWSGKLDESKQYYSDAREAFRADGNLHAEASALGNLSRVLIELGDVEAAVVNGRRTAAILRYPPLVLAKGVETPSLVLA